MTETLHTPRPSELVEHFLAEAISNSPQPLKDLALFLSSALSEDDWKTADRLLLALALRNRTSEPAGDAVAWRARMRPDGEWMVLDAEYVPGRSADDAVEVQPLFTHPAALSADHAELTRLAEAAGEEALGNLLAVIHGDGGHRALEVGTKQAALEAEKIVAGLFAAPSADKLRIAFEAFQSVKRHSVLGSVNFNTAVEALAALKAEG